MAWAFRVRSQERDARTDQERFQSLDRAISAALNSVRSERDALRARVDNARDLASFAAGTGADEYLDREPKDVERLREYERQMEQGSGRLLELERQLEGLGKVREAYEQFLGVLFEPVPPR